MICLRFASCMVSDIAVVSYVGYRSRLTGLIKALAPYDAYVGVLVNTRCPYVVLVADEMLMVLLLIFVWIVVR